MSSFSGEIGLSYRTAYCASKFAVTGFFESLRMELQDTIDITIICPVTVETSFREHSLLNNVEHTVESKENNRKAGSSLAINDAIEVILMSIDKKARKVIFPSKAYYANYFRPFFPDYIDKKLY